MLRRYDVGSGPLALETEGSGEPPAIFVSGIRDGRDVWRQVLDRLNVRTVRVMYDRPGVGGSQPLPRELRDLSHGFLHAADELRLLLDAADVDAPRVLVGHSVGALIAYLYAAAWPDECAGLVLVDPSDAQMLSELPSLPYLTDSDGTGTLFDWRVGADEVAKARPPVVPSVIVASAVGRWHREKDPEKYGPLTLAQVDERWQQWQHTLANTLGASLIIANESGHRVHEEAPALVALAVDAVVRHVHSAGRNRIDGGAVLRAGGKIVRQRADVA